ncbi:MAG: type II toxin-antitoxin system RelE/ParE family toxin [Chloroflexi bacterium]|nr:type II toxin-antitoxin system RelE/ParE family toxin [Chloroflexota bacterium]
MRLDQGKPIIWLSGEIKTPPFSTEARVEAGVLLRQVQRGESPAAPHSRPMPVIEARCHELRIRERNKIWRVIYRTDHDAVIVLAVFQKTTRTTPRNVIENSRRRLSQYDAAVRNDRR